MTKNKTWANALSKIPDKARAVEALEKLSSLYPDLQKASKEQAQTFVKLFEGSKALTELLLAHPEFCSILFDHESLSHPRQAQGLQKEVNAWVEPALQKNEYASAFNKLRLFKQKEMLRIAARDLARLGNLQQTVLSISNVADICLQTAWKLSWQQLTQKHGIPCHEWAEGKWTATPFVVLGMGKLGGQELNYSSDVDLLFVYEQEGFVLRNPQNPNEKVMPNHSFFKKLSEAIIQEMTQMTQEGSLFRVDMRLRPEGKSGPLARSLSSYEYYYAQWGQTWERMMMIKARPVAGNAELGASFMEMIQPFRYPRVVGEQIPHEIAAMKQRIENEVVKSGELESNVKLGYGGIREIEFIAQMFQILHGGKLPFLQSHQTLPTLDNLVKYQFLDKKVAEDLKEAYIFLRDVEHRLQMEHNRQTHTIPNDPGFQERLAWLMGFSSVLQFQRKLQERRTQVRKIYQTFIRSDAPPAEFPLSFESNEPEWKEILKKHGFKEPERSLKFLREFVEGPGFGHISSRTTETAFQLVRRILKWSRKGGAADKEEPILSDPDRVLARLDSFAAAYGARATLYEAWNTNPSLFKLLLLTFDRSEFLAELAIRTPDLIDEIEQSGQLRRKKNSAQILEELSAGQGDSDQFRWFRRYHQAELMRLGLRDILQIGTSKETNIYQEITSLADGEIQYALLQCTRLHKLKIAPFAVIALGKFGGQELVYGSDLDFVLVASEKPKDLAKLQKMAIWLLDFLTKRTEDGAPWEADTRLRPDGAKGLLVNTISAFEEYYKKRAMLWEIQALTRSRFVAGDQKTGNEWIESARKLANFKVLSPIPSAYKPDWKTEIYKMRIRIERERTPAALAAYSLKTGPGGLIDAEFLAQTWCLEHGWHEPNTEKALLRGKDEKVLPPDHISRLLTGYYRLQNVERILRRWSYQSESELPKDEAPLERVSWRCGFERSAQFLKSFASWKEDLRSVFDFYFLKSPKKSA